MRQFASPHVHVQSLDTASTPEAFARREVEMGGAALTCTDHGTLEAAYQVYKLAKKGPDDFKKTAGRAWTPLVPIVGLEAYFRDDNDPVLTMLGVQRTDTIPKGMADVWQETHPDGKSFYDYWKYAHLTLHAMDYEGYTTLARLLSAADLRAERHGSERKPLFDWAAVEEIASKNITATTSCLAGVCQRHLQAGGGEAAADAFVGRLKHLFKDRLYAEVFPHDCSHYYVNAVFADVSGEGIPDETIKWWPNKKLKVERSSGAQVELTAEQFCSDFDPLDPATVVQVMNNRRWEDLNPRRLVKAIRREQGFVQNECNERQPDGDIQKPGNALSRMLAARYDIPVLVSDDAHYAHPDEQIVQDVRLAQSGGSFRFYGKYHRQSSDDAWDFFQKHGYDVSRGEFEGWVENSLGWVERFKDFKWEVKPELATKFFPKDTLKHTLDLIKRRGRMPKSPAHVARLKTEIELLHRNGTIDLLPYFHSIEEVCRVYANQGDLTGAGRGSAAGLLLSYLIGITHLDPVKHDLSLERFLTMDRVKSGKLPDVDQDLPDRALLDGGRVPSVEFRAEDGTTHVLPEDFKVETDQGLLTIREAAQRGADVVPWWTV